MKILIKRRSSAPKADNTIGMYKRDGGGAYTTSEEDKIDEISVQDIKDRVVAHQTRKVRIKKNRASHQSYLADKQAKLDAKGGNTADSIRLALKGTKFARRPVLKNSFDPTLDEIRNPLRNDPPAVAATKKLGAKRVRLAKRADAADAHTAMVNRLHAARGTKPNKPLGIWKDKIKSEGTNARQRGEIQSPRSEKEYDALSPENKKIVDKRTQNARAQSMLPNPNSSPPRPSNPQRRNKANQRRARAIRQQTSEYTPDHGESLGEVVSKAVKTDRRAMTTQELKKRHPNDSEARAGAGGKHRKSGKMARVAYSNWRDVAAAAKKEDQNENLAYSKPDKKGRTFVVSKRKTKGMRGKQDQVSMSVRDSKGNIEDHGSHVNVKGAKKYATSRGYDMGEGRRWGKEVGAEWDEGPDTKATRRDNARSAAHRKTPEGRAAEKAAIARSKAMLARHAAAKNKQQQNNEYVPEGASKPPPAPPKDYKKKHPLSQKDRAAIRNKLGQKKYPQTEEVSWEEAQYWSEDTVAAFLKRGGKITKVKPRVARGATKKKTIRLRGSTKSTADRGRKAEKKVHGEEVEYVDEAKMGEILRNTKKGTAPYTIVAHKAGRVVGQEHTKTVQAVPAFVREIQKKYPNAKISVEDRRGRVLHTEEYIDEGGMGGRHFNVKGGSIPSNAEIKAFYEKQKGSPSQRIAATKKHFGLQKMTVSARGIVSAKGIREAVSVDGRTRDYRGTRTRLESKGRRLGAGLDGRTKGYRDAYARTMARQQRAAADAAMMEPTEDTSTEIEEMQKGSNQSPVDASTASSNLKYKSGSRHATGTSKRPEKKRASKAARQLDKEDLKDLMHKKDLDNRHRRREDKAAQRTAKSKRSFGPKGKRPAGTMQVAFRKALEKKRG